MPDGQSSHNNSRFPDSAMALTFDDVLIRPGPSDVLPNEVRCWLARHPNDLREHPDPVLGHGHGHRGPARHRHGAGRRHRRHSPQHGCRSCRPPKSPR